MGEIVALEKLFKKHGFDDYKWMNPSHIVIAQWVRMKCTFGCGGYGHSAVCPPNVPSVEECERFFREYNSAVIFHFEGKVDKPEDRHAWTQSVNRKLLDLERDVFIAGYPKTFLLFMDTCGFCDDCCGLRADCTNPKMARPAPEAFCVDVFATVKHYGYPLDVLQDYDQVMNRYAFIMVE